MAVTISPTINFTAVETLDKGVDAAPAPTVVHSSFNLTGVTLNSASTPPVTMASYQTYALSGGAFIIDLRALLGVNDEVQDANGLKLQTIIIRNKSGNNPITIGEGATNGYPIWGAGNDLIVPADSEQGMKFNETLPDVSATDKTIDVSGTGSETFDVGIVLG